MATILPLSQLRGLVAGYAVSREHTAHSMAKPSLPDSSPGSLPKLPQTAFNLEKRGSDSSGPKSGG